MCVYMGECTGTISSCMQACDADAGGMWADVCKRVSRNCKYGVVGLGLHVQALVICPGICSKTCLDSTNSMESS